VALAALALVVGPTRPTTTDITVGGDGGLDAGVSCGAMCPPDSCSQAPAPQICADKRTLLAAYATLTASAPPPSNPGLPAQLAAIEQFEDTLSRIIFPDSAVADARTLKNAAYTYYGDGRGSLAAVRAAMNTVVSDLGG
jgi:hypothetical protein